MFNFNPQFIFQNIIHNTMMKIRFIMLLILGVFQSTLLLNAQKAFDFTAKDINGIEYNLYDILSTGKYVFLDVSATWCGPCWSLKQTEVVKDYMKKHGPIGDKTAEIFFIEPDPTTTLDDLKGLTSGSQGNWIEGANYPIIDNSSIANMFGVNAYPTLLVVCPDLSVKTVSSYTVAGIEQVAATCVKEIGTSKPDFRVSQNDGCESLDVTFIDNSWPRPDAYTWDFGDGTTSSERKPTHSYTKEGQYSVSLNVKDAKGESEILRPGLITVGKGFAKPTGKVGPADNKYGAGRIFEGGHQALIVDAFEPFVLESVKVYSDREMERTIVLLNEDGDLVNSKTINIPIGEHRINLDFYFPKGQNYKLGLQSDAFLYRNATTTKYPFLFQNILSIKETTAAPANPGYYYYFYDWDVRQAGCTEALATDDASLPSFKIMPNPASKYLEVKGDFSKDHKANVFDVMGKNVLSMAVDKNSSSMRIDVSSLNNGMYMIKIGKYTQKLIIQH
jgi:PKD repeat protein